MLKGAITLSDVPPKRLTKKQKAAMSKMREAQQWKSANETARMAILGLASSKKSYSWLDGGAASPAASLGQKANAGNKKGNTSNAGLSSISCAYGSARTGPLIERGKPLGEWDENDDGAIQARDVLLVLETDGQAVKALSRAYNTPEKAVER